MFRLYSSRKKDLLRIFVLSIISISIIATALIFIKTNEAATLEQFYEIYGKYTISIEDDNFSSYDKISADKKDIQPNQLLVQLTDIADFENIMDNITEKYNVDEDLCFINFDLFMVLGFIEDNNVVKQNDLFYLFLYTIILICTVVSLYNFIKLMVCNSYSDIAVLNLLGISKNLIVSVLFFVIILTILLATIIGMLLGLAISNLVIVKFLTNLNTMHLFLHSFPHITMIISMGVYVVVAILIMLPIIIGIQKLSPNFLMQMRQTDSKKVNKKSKKHLFNQNSRFFTYKIAKNNIMNSKKSFNISVFALTSSIFVFVLGLYFIFANLQAFGHETDMDYRISYFDTFTMSDEELTIKEELYHKLEGIYDLCSVYPIHISNLDGEFDKKALNKQYIKYLRQSVEDRIALSHGLSETVQLRVLVLGYNELQLQELHEKNGLNYNQPLGDNEIVVLNMTLPTRSDIGFELDFQKNDSVNLNLYSETETFPKDFIIKETVDELVTYPKAEVNKICFIMNESLYKKWDNIITPDDFYVKLNSTDIINKEKVESMLIGNPNINMSIPKEEEAMINKANQILKVVIMVFFVIIVLSAGISILSTLHIRIYTKETEYAMLNAIGIGYSKIKQIIYLELIAILARSIIISGFLSFVGTYYMQILLLGSVGKYMYKFPFSTFVFSCTVTLITLLLMSLPILNRVKNINTVMILKNDA